MAEACHTVGIITRWLKRATRSEIEIRQLKRATRSEIQVRWLEPTTRIIYILVVAVTVYVNGIDGISATVAEACHTVGSTTTVAEACHTVGHTSMVAGTGHAGRSTHIWYLSRSTSTGLTELQIRWLLHATPSRLQEY